MIIYIKDSTYNPPVEVTFDTYISSLKYLEEMCKRQYSQTRKQRMLELESIGYGYDDSSGVNFVRSMAENTEMGVIREGRRMRCDITGLLFDKSEYGN